jgi:hypothetical protein
VVLSGTDCVHRRSQNTSEGFRACALQILRAPRVRRHDNPVGSTGCDGDQRGATHARRNGAILSTCANKRSKAPARPPRQHYTLSRVRKGLYRAVVPGSAQSRSVAVHVIEIQHLVTLCSPSSPRQLARRGVNEAVELREKSDVVPLSGRYCSI